MAERPRLKKSDEILGALPTEAARTRRPGGPSAVFDTDEAAPKKQNGQRIEVRIFIGHGLARDHFRRHEARGTQNGFGNGVGGGDVVVVTNQDVARGGVD